MRAKHITATLLLLSCTFFLFYCQSGEQQSDPAPASSTPDVEKSQNETNTPPEGMSDLELGTYFANQAQQKLSKNLLSAIQMEGYPYAVSFCRTRALSITDSVASEYDISVRRVTDQPRNPKNMAGDRELERMAEFRQSLSEGEAPEGIIENRSNEVVFYAPIMTQGLCLNCHGQPNKDIAEPTLKRIEGEYPQDAATGYAVNELRGMWRIQWEETSSKR